MRPNDDDNRESEGVDLEKAVWEAINNVIAEVTGDFPIKGVLIVEVLDKDGERGIWTSTTPDAKRWDIDGLIFDAQQHQMAHRVVEIQEAHRRYGEDD